MSHRSTVELLRDLPAMLGTRRRATVATFGYQPEPDCIGCAIGLGCGGRCYAVAAESMGAEPDPSTSTGILSAVDAAAARANAALSWAAAQPGQLAASSAGWVRAQLLAAQADLLAAGRAAVDAGAGGAASIIDQLSSRVGDALAQLGGGAGDAFREFWGLSPAAIVGGGALLAAGLVAALALSPGGQAWLAAVGGGVGSQLASMGSGVGQGIAGAGQGVGAGFAAFGGSIPALAKAL